VTEATARQLANGILAVTAIGAAVVVVRTPSLRRLAWRLALAAATVTIPAWLNREVRTAWVESGRKAVPPLG